MTHRVLLLGAGKIGRMIARMLHQSGDYEVCVADSDCPTLERVASMLGVKTCPLDVADNDAMLAAMQGQSAVISALSFHWNPAVARAALKAGASYFDLTEDIATTRQVMEVARSAQVGQIFMPQCGLAPGFISIVAHHLAHQFDSLDTVRMRVGALPQFPTDALKYNLTWSTDGLINEYCNPCDAIHDGRRIEVLPLEGLEHFSIDGDRYEAFNTSGGLGTLCETLDGRLRELNYKTIRYMGHRDLIAFLVCDLRLGEKREILKQILEEAVPVTFQDVVVTFCTVTGMRKRQFVQMSDARKIYSQTLDGENWSAIQITTAAGLCAVLDMHFNAALPEQGFVRQEQVSLESFLQNRFGRHYQDMQSPRLGG